MVFIESGIVKARPSRMGMIWNIYCIMQTMQELEPRKKRIEHDTKEKKAVVLKEPFFDDGTTLICSDPWLEPFRDALRARQIHFLKRFSMVESAGGLLGPISQGYRYFGFNRAVDGQRKGVWYREWAPGAKALFLMGDFNDWSRSSHPLKCDEYGVWSIFLPDSEYKKRLLHTSRIKVHVITEKMGGVDRIPAYIRRAVQNEKGDFTGQFWMPESSFHFRHSSPHLTSSLKIYEAHAGMALEEGRVGTFKEFTQFLLPRIARLGYNAIQLMAVMEHPYYGSFGYHISNFYAVSSRFGTPEDLKELIDTAHSMGFLVFLDLVHSHSVKNTNEGLNLFDGTDYQYFHAGHRGLHIAWDSILFDYSKYEVLRFLLSNVRFWLEEYRFDGFRFDGVTSMLYLDHGLGKTFSGYADYFGPNIDEDAVSYLKLANLLAHSVTSNAVTIAEDVSGMVGMARPVEEGGLGFDYRLAMGVPDYWIKILKERKDEEWDLQQLYYTLLNRRRDEKHVAYAESHDQALVGDKTIAFRLMDQEMYWKMSYQTSSDIIDRGIALHKLIRLITFSLGGDAWLNFMGNEFGHPEWIDFPRQGNNWSYHYARRQWSLADRDDLKYQGLLKFDQALMALDEKYGVLNQKLIEQLLVHNDTKQLAYFRGPLVFVFNFHPTQSFVDLRIPVPKAQDYQVILNTDDPKFAGYGLVHSDMIYPWQKVEMYHRAQTIQLYLPVRSAQVLAPLSAVEAFK